MVFWCQHRDVTMPKREQGHQARQYNDINHNHGLDTTTFLEAFPLALFYIYSSVG